MLLNIQTRRTKGNSRDIVATSASALAGAAPSRARALSVESNVQSRIAQLQRKSSVGTILERTLNIPATNSQPLSFGPSPASSSASVTLVDTLKKMQTVTIESSLIDRLESMQQLFDQSLQRALRENANQYKSLQSQVQTISGSMQFQIQPISGSISSLQENMLEVDESCRRNLERIDAFEVQEDSERIQELEPVREEEGDTEYDSGGYLGFYR